MKQLELKSTLKKLGSARLANLVGHQRLEMIYDVLSTSVRESKLVDLLQLRYGSQILAQKEIRTALFLVLAPEYQGYIYDGNFIDGRVLSQNERTRLDSQWWGRTRASTKRALNVFGLSDEYLPPKEEMPPSVESIQPDTILFPYQRRVKDRYVRTLLGGADRLLLHMPTGAGKTRTCIEGLIDCLRAFSDRSGYVVCLAHSEELCEQALDTFKTLWSVRGDEGIDVFRLWGKHPSPDFSHGSGFVVASLQRIHAMRLSRKDETFIQAG